MKSRLQKNKGFTIVELLVVILMIAILAIVMGTSMVRWLPDYRFNKYILGLQGALQNARLTAVKNDADVFIEFDKTNHRLQVFLDDASDAANRGVLDAGDTTIEAPETPSGVVFTELFGTGDLLAVSTFNSRGFSDRAGQIRMKNDTDKYKGVNLTLGGNSRIIKSPDGGITWQ